MPSIFSKPGLLRWWPNASAYEAPAGALLLADNLETDEPNVIRKRKGSTTIYTGLGTNVHSLYTFYVNGTRYRMAVCDDTLYVNGVSTEREFDGTGTVQMTNWLGHVYMARGTTKLKFDGTNVTNWGIPKPGKRPVAEAGATVQEYFSTFNSSESPAWSAEEGTITGTYPDGSDGVANGSLELTPASTGRGTIKRVYSTAVDYWTVDGYEGANSDIIDLMVWFDTPQDVEYVDILFGVSPIDVSDSFRDDYYVFRFKIGGELTSAPKEEVFIKSAEAATEQVIETVAQQSVTQADPDVTGGPANIGTIETGEPTPAPDDIIEDIRRRPLLREFRGDASYNPGWSHLTVSRGAFTRVGTSNGRDWRTVRAAKIVYKAKTSSTGKVRFDNLQIYGGGDRALTGKFSFLYRQARATRSTSADGDFEFTEKSPPSDPSEYEFFNTQLARLTITEDAIAGFDPQTNQLWVYMTGGYLDDWYRVAVTGASANDTNMGIDEFPRSPDGTISAFDRMRFLQGGISVPGEIAAFVPSDIPGLTLWLDADYIDDVSDGSLVQYWPGRVDYASFTPTDVSSLTGWFKADSGVYSDAGTTLAVGGDSVTQWNDQSGNGYNLSQATGAKKPTYRVSIVNSKPVVRFDGLDDFLSGTTASNLLAAGTKYVMFVFNAATLPTSGANPYDNSTIWSTAGGIVSSYLHATNGLGSYNFDGTVDTAVASVAAGTWYLGIYAHGTDDWNNAANLGVSIGSGSFFGGFTVSASGNSTNLTNAVYIGASSGATSYLHGDLAEILFFNAIPSPQERLKLERYLVAKYAIPSYDFDSADTTISARVDSSALQPTYKASWRNSKPAVYFSGSDAMEVCATLGEVMTNSAKTVFIVGEVDTLIGTPGGAGSQDNNLILCDFPAGNPKFAPLSIYSGSLQGYNDDGAVDYITARVYALDTPYIWTVLHDSGTLYSGQNDSRTASMNTATSGNSSAVTGGLRVGSLVASSANKRFNGYIAEILIYNAALTETERKQVESYLASKYDLSSQIPYGLTASFDANAATTNDLILTLAADEINARIQNVKLPVGLNRPPDNIISVDADYADRLWCLTTKGYLYFSERREPGMFRYPAAMRVGSKSETPYWVRRTAQGIYVGTSKSIYWVSGTGSEDASGVPDFTKIDLNVADPPINYMVTADGNDLLYMSARGPMVLSSNNVTPLPVDGVSLLWQGEARHGISAINLATGTFKAASFGGNVYLQVPEGASTTTTTRVWKYSIKRQTWARLVYPYTISTLYREPDGTVLIGTNDGKVVEIEDTSNSLDDSAQVAVVLRGRFEDGGFPLSRKDLFDFTLRGDTGNTAATISLYKDNSASATTTLSMTLNGQDTFLDDIDAVGVVRNLQIGITGSFTTFTLSEFNCEFRPRPQHRVHVDTGYLRKAGEDYVWFRLARLCMIAGSDVAVEFYFDDVLYATKTVTVTTGKALVYEVPLGREYKGRQPRIVIRKSDSASTVADEGFELFWLELRQRPSGNVTKFDVKKVFTDVAAPLEKAVAEKETVQ